MTISTTIPEIIFLRRENGVGYGFFYHSPSDFKNAADSFTNPIMLSFTKDPIPGQPKASDHLKVAFSSFLAQAFEGILPPEMGAEGVSRAVAACVMENFRNNNIPQIVVIERNNKQMQIRSGIEFLQHPGYPMAIVVESNKHGGMAYFFSNHDEYKKSGERYPDNDCWLPQIIYRLYASTPSVIIGKPRIDPKNGKPQVECRAMSFGRQVPLVERR